MVDSKPTNSFICMYEDCNKTFNRLAKLEEHAHLHTGEKPFTCIKCGKSFIRKRNLDSHMSFHLTVNERPFQCPFQNCDKSFRLITNLRQHERLHSIQKPFKCTEQSCEKAFTNQTQLDRHNLTVHQGKRPHLCTWEGCDKSFPTPSKLKRHLASHALQKQYICTYCPELFSTIANLKQHTLTAHMNSDENTDLDTTRLWVNHVFTCPECPRSFSTINARNCHVKYHHPISEPVLKPEFVCTQCTKHFTTKYNLQTHIKTFHLNIKPYTCTQCDKQFVTMALLNRHTLSMHKTRVINQRKRTCPVPPIPHPSAQLLMDFTGADAARTFKCEQCARRFLREYDLIRHVTAQHSNVKASSNGLVIELPKQNLDRRTKVGKEQALEQLVKSGHDLLLPLGLDCIY